jgi:hypothetical protein
MYEEECKYEYVPSRYPKHVVPTRETYSVETLQGFTQLRIVGEDNTIEAADHAQVIGHAEVLNPSQEYGEVTRFLAVDTEFDNQLLCRVTLVNERGEVVVDTLVSQSEEDLEKINHRRQEHIHGITTDMLKHAPRLEDVIAYL